MKPAPPTEGTPSVEDGCAVVVGDEIEDVEDVFVVGVVVAAAADPAAS